MAITRSFVTGPKKTDTDEVKEKKGRSKEPEKRPLVMRPEPVVVEPRRTFNEEGKTLIIV